MPKAFSLAFGLDLETEVASFWAWLNDTRGVLDGTGPESGPVRELVESQREEIERLAAESADPQAARFVLTVALALVGSQYASHQKLLNGLQEYGLLRPSYQPPPAIFDTITEPSLEGPEPPR